MKPKLQFGKDHYRLVCGSQEGELVEYGDAATLDTGLTRYLAMVEQDGNNEVVSMLPEGEWVVEGRVVEADLEDVDFATAGEQEQEREQEQGEVAGQEGGTEEMDEEIELDDIDEEDEDEDEDLDLDDDDDMGLDDDEELELDEEEEDEEGL